MVTRTLARAVESPSHTVLVVDDDSSIRFLCRVNLELDGWNVREAATLAAARQELTDAEVDLLLLDLHVGHENAVDFVGEVRGRHPRLPVALLTGSVGTPALEGLEADAVIAKPFKLAELTQAARKLVARIPQRAG
jgi:DNA-binding response OmpR family regulator